MCPPVALTDSAIVVRSNGAQRWPNQSAQLAGHALSATTHVGDRPVPRPAHKGCSRTLETTTLKMHHLAAQTGASGRLRLPEFIMFRRASSGRWIGKSFGNGMAPGSNPQNRRALAGHGVRGPDRPGWPGVRRPSIVILFDDVFMFDRCSNQYVEMERPTLAS